jgi:hypothetical protein
VNGAPVQVSEAEEKVTLEAEERFSEPRHRYPDTPNILKAVAELNEEGYFVVANFGGHCVVAWEALDPAFPESKTPILYHLSIYDFTSWHRNRPVQIGTDEKPEWKNKGDAWLDHPLRKEYDKVQFAPKRDLGPKILNRWHGFAFEPRKGDCSLYLEHLRENICAGDSVKYNYLIGWMAHAVRNPGEQGHVAIVVSGAKGTGKNVFAEGFNSLWGRHGMIVSSPERLTSHFNFHLADKCCFISDEATHAGDRRAEGRIKALITGDSIDIEAKGLDVVTMPNFLHVIIIGNSENLVNVTHDERRYLVMRCGTKHQKDQPYFAKIKHQLKNGGYQVLLYHLLEEVDLANFSVRAAPHTAELVRLMGSELRGAEGLWYQCLATGVIPGELQKDGTVDLTVPELLNWAAEQPRRQEWRWIRPQHVGHLFGPAGGFNFQSSRIRGTSGCQLRTKSIPTLSVARKLWDQKQFRGSWNDEDGWKTDEWEVAPVV